MRTDGKHYESTQTPQAPAKPTHYHTILDATPNVLDVCLTKDAAVNTELYTVNELNSDILHPIDPLKTMFQPASSHNFRNFTKFLETKQLAFHTYQLHEENTHKVVHPCRHP